MLVGYWGGGHRSGSEPEDLTNWLDLLPDPHDFIDMEWDYDERHRVVGLLRLGTTLAAWKGYSGCRICGCSNGTRCLTLDGTWAWPEGFAHYVDAHAVRPPQEFIDHLFSIDPELLAEMKLHAANKDAIKAKWEPLYRDTSTCPDKGTTCKYEDAGELGFRCEKKLGTHGISRAYSCLSALDRSNDAYQAERDRHTAKLTPLIKISWESEG